MSQGTPCFKDTKSISQAKREAPDFIRLQQSVLVQLALFLTFVVVVVFLLL